MVAVILFVGVISTIEGGEICWAEACNRQISLYVRNDAESKNKKIKANSGATTSDEIPKPTFSNLI